MSIGTRDGLLSSDFRKTARHWTSLLSLLDKGALRATANARIAWVSHVASYFARFALIAGSVGHRLWPTARHTGGSIKCHEHGSNVYVPAWLMGKSARQAGQACLEVLVPKSE